MRNTMTLRGVRTWILAAALGAACGGGDPPGGGNNGGTTDGGDTTDGTTGNGGTDGYVPNPNKPLIEAIPGLWEVVDMGGSTPCCSSSCDCTNTDCAETPPGVQRPCAPARDNGICAVLGCAVVDPSNPNCQHQLQLVDPPPIMIDLGPPGDACVWWFHNPEAFILDGSTLRSDPPPSCPGRGMPFCSSMRGNVLDNGARMEYTVENWSSPDRSDLVIQSFAFRKVR